MQHESSSSKDIKEQIFHHHLFSLKVIKGWRVNVFDRTKKIITFLTNGLTSVFSNSNVALIIMQLWSQISILCSFPFLLPPTRRHLWGNQMRYPVSVNIPSGFFSVWLGQLWALQRLEKTLLHQVSDKKALLLRRSLHPNCPPSTLLGLNYAVVYCSRLISATFGHELRPLNVAPEVFTYEADILKKVLYLESCISQNIPFFFFSIWHARNAQVHTTKMLFVGQWIKKNKPPFGMGT